VVVVCWCVRECVSACVRACVRACDACARERAALELVGLQLVLARTSGEVLQRNRESQEQTSAVCAARGRACACGRSVSPSAPVSRHVDAHWLIPRFLACANPLPCRPPHCIMHTSVSAGRPAREKAMGRCLRSRSDAVEGLRIGRLDDRRDEPGRRRDGDAHVDAREPLGRAVAEGRIHLCGWSRPARCGLMPWCTVRVLRVPDRMTAE
jgi:hypothetical protein